MVKGEDFKHFLSHNYQVYLYQNEYSCLTKLGHLSNGTCYLNEKPVVQIY